MGQNVLNIAFIPIDNRPVCYTLAEQIAKIDSCLNLMLPERSFLGDLKKAANIDAILNWLENLEKVDKVIVSLDTIAHGGLVPSRRSTDSFEEIKSRVEKLKKILESKGAQVYAFSSVMRISNNNVNEEEKEYWSLYGEKLFQYSFDFHKNGSATADVPDEIVKDYLATRQRNFEINKLYLDWTRDNFFKTLVFSKDDCAQFGLNVKEAKEFQGIIDNENLCAMVKTGADEIPLSLLSRALTDEAAVEGKVVKILPIFTQPDFVGQISKYEDVSVYESVKGQIELAGAVLAEKEAKIEDADIVLVVNNFREQQGELIMGVDVEGFGGDFQLPEKPFLIADILNANGSDNAFVERLFEKKIDWESFFGYAGWNTTGNTLGSVLCCALVKFLAMKPDSQAFKEVQAVRFLDDWAYQANVRKHLKNYLSGVSVEELKKSMQSFEKKLGEKFDMNLENTEYSYPWDRFFEIEVKI